MRAGNAALFMFVLLPPRIGTLCAGDRPRRNRDAVPLDDCFMRRREILRLPVSAQGKEAAVRLPLSLGFLC